MSYASRLLAMSNRRAMARSSAIVERHDVVAVEPARPQQSRTPVVSQPTETKPELPPIAPSARHAIEPTPTPAPVAPSARHAIEPATEPRAPRTTAVPATSTVSAPAAPMIAPVIAPREPAAPSLPEWLAERPERGDPLNALGVDQTLREALRSAREWTSSPPTPIIAAKPTKPSVEPPQRDGAKADDPVSVSIGNVVITVEDAPAPQGRPPRAAVTKPDGSASRLARNYVRGR